jgi:sensor histidine kinase YesM
MFVEIDYPGPSKLVDLNMQNGSAIVTPFNNPFIRFISEKKYRWLRHILFILLGLVLAFKGDIGVAGRFQSEKIRDTVLLVDSMSFIFIMGVIYFLLLILIPKLLFRSRIFLFSACFFLCIVIIYLGVWAFDHYFLKPVDPAGMLHVDLSLIHFIQVGAVCAVLLGSVVGLKVFKKWINDVKRMNELHEINLKTELEQLKSQVNPHFLFNTLNNLLVLLKTDPEKASQVLLGLSDLLRYQLYDSAKERIMLVKDIAFLRNLLELEKIRKNDFEYTIEIQGNIDGVSLPPFLFIPFVENAIKHGASTVGHSYLTLKFSTSQAHITFTAENSKPMIKTNGVGGLGLKNIHRRLELLYPGTHQLKIADERDKYIVTLTLPL